jgi:hypothetical protein
LFPIGNNGAQSFANRSPPGDGRRSCGFEADAADALAEDLIERAAALEET